MERQTRGITAAIDGITQEGVADVGEMDADLMSTPAVEVDIELAAPRKATDNAQVGHGGSPGVNDRHALTVAVIPANGRVDARRLLGEAAVHQRPVAASQGATLQLRREMAVGTLSLGDHQQTTGVAVEAVNDSGTFGAPQQRPGVAALAQPVGQSSVGVTRGRVDDEPGGLVDDGDALVLEGDAQCHRRSREGRCSRKGRLRHNDGVAGTHASTGATWSAVDGDVTSGDKIMGLVPRCPTPASQPEVQALTLSSAHPGGRACARGERNVTTARSMPPTMAMSATLKTGQK